MTDDPGLARLRSIIDAHGRLLLALAGAAIRSPLAGRPLAVGPTDVPAALAERGASFVTLRHGEELRGCVGSNRAWRPLIDDVIENANVAAFSEPRFPPLTAAELDGLSLSVSLLTALEPVAATSEPDLLTKLRPGRDGVMIADGSRRGLFLPEMWAELPKPAEFMAWLKRKAGLPDTYWSRSLQVERFATMSIKAPDIRDLPEPETLLAKAPRNLDA
jgi:AmmeMemoRadiSam system protein A